MQYKTICLDYDGTIHNSVKIYTQAFLKAYQYLVDEGYAPTRVWKTDEVKKFLGQNPKEMWDNLAPTVPKEVISVASGMIGVSMVGQINNGKSELFDGAIETLNYLKEKGYYLVYLSNSRTIYMDTNKKVFGLEPFFDEFISSEMYNHIPKKEILKSIKDRLPQPILMVGDRIHDMESGMSNGIDTVACLYGYGTDDEFKGSTYQIKDIRDLMNIL